MSVILTFVISSHTGCSVWLDLQGSVEKTIRIIKEAAAEGAKIIGFPEVFIPGMLANEKQCNALYILKDILGLLGLKISSPLNRFVLDFLSVPSANAGVARF